MKKLMIAASAAFCAAVALADVTSANIVGYNTVTIKPGWNMLAVNFKNVADDNGVSIQDLFPGGGKADTVYTYAGTASEADNVQVWDNSTGKYTTYFLYKKAKGTSENNFYWCDSSDGAIASTKFKNGDAFWFLKRGESDVTATVSGEVTLDAIKSVAIKNGWNMIGSFFPAGWKVNDEYYTPAYWEKSGAIFAGTAAEADNIQVWDPVAQKYTTYLLYKKAKGTSDDNYKWCDSADGTPATGDILSAGKGAWYLHRGSGFNLEIKKQF